MKKKTKTAVVLKPSKVGHLISKDRLFIKGSKFNDKKMRRVELILRVLICIGLAAILAAVGFFIFGFLIPYLQSQLADTPVNAPPQTGSVVSMESSMNYDNIGLPVLSDEVSLKLINTSHPATEEYAPEVQTVSGVPGSTAIATALKTMLTAAENDGQGIELSAGYISYEEQNTLYEDKVTSLMQQNNETLVMARTHAKQEVPVAGESDFQTGLCIRISADKEVFSSSKTYEWLEKNMGKYGFVFRFPSGKKSYTGLEADYTVIRYVGQEHAEIMRQLSMSLEEYVKYLNNR